MRTPVFDSFDKETLIRFLGDVIEAEMDKPDDEINLELIEECDGFLSELLSDVTVSDGQMKENIAKIKGMAAPCAITPICPRRIPRPRRLVAAILAAVLLIGGSVTAYAFVPAFRDVVCYVLNLDSGSQIEDGGLTYVYQGKTTTYKNMEELVKTEELGILSLHNLPQELRIKTIVVAGEGKDLVYSISFEDGAATIKIYAYEIDISTLSKQSEAYVNERNIVSYMLIRDKTTVSTTVHDGWTYYITTNTLENLKIILENLY